jgi:hypothetical protein
MRRHELDPWSLLFGAIFLFVAASYLLTHTTSMHLHWMVAVPAAVIVIGIGVLGYSVRRMRSAEAPEVPSDTEIPTSQS